MSRHLTLTTLFNDSLHSGIDIPDILFRSFYTIRDLFTTDNNRLGQ